MIPNSLTDFPLKDSKISTELSLQGDPSEDKQNWGPRLGLFGNFAGTLLVGTYQPQWLSHSRK